LRSLPMLVLTILHCLVGFSILGLAVATGLRRHGGWQSHDRTMAYAVGLCVAPALAGLSLLPFFLLGHMFVGAPLLAVVGAILFIGRQGLHIILADLKAVRDAWVLLKEKAGPAFLLTNLTIILAIVFTMLLLSMPVIENDALEYAAVAKFLANEGSLSHYPLTVADKTTGLYAPSLHPPVFHLLLVWSQAVGYHANDLQSTSLVGQRLASVFSFSGTCFLVFVMGRRIGFSEAIFGLLLLFSVPFLTASVIAYGIDAPRIAAFTAAAAAVALAAEKPSSHRCVVAAGMISATAMWLHSIGFLVPFFGAITLLICSKGYDRWRRTSLYVFVAFLMGGAWYLRNQFYHGLPLSDQWPASAWPNLSYDADLAARRGLGSVFERFVNGVLRPWKEPALFGSLFWIVAIGMFAMRVFTSHMIVRVAMIWLCGFAMIACFSSLIGSSLVIKNPRYWLTLAPLAAVCAGAILATFWQKHGAWRVTAVGVLSLSLLWSVASLAISTIGYASPLLALQGNEQAFLDRPRVTGGPLVKIPQASETERVLSFRPPFTAIYGRSHWIDHLDPTLQAVHSAPVEDAFVMLQQRHVRWAYLHDYSPVTHARSTLADLLSDPRFATPVATHRNARLFAIHVVPRATICKVKTTPHRLEVRQRRTGFGDVLAQLTGIPHLAGLFQRETDSAVSQILQWSPLVRSSLTVQGLSLTGRFAVNVLIEGAGVVAVDAEFHHPVDGMSSLRLIDGLLDEKPRRFAAQGLVRDGARLIGVRVSPLAPNQGHARVVSVSLCSVE
jgi:hypothetical protein